MTGDILFANFRVVVNDLFVQGHTLVASAHLILYHLDIIIASRVLVFLDALNRSPTKAVPDMLNEVGSITYLLALKSVDKGTRSDIEAI